MSFSEGNKSAKDYYTAQGTTSPSYTCGGKHRFFVAETVGVPNEGSVHIIALCTDCGEGIVRSFKVAKETSPLLLGSETKKDKQE